MLRAYSSSVPASPSASPGSLHASSRAVTGNSILGGADCDSGALRIVGATSFEGGDEGGDELTGRVRHASEDSEGEGDELAPAGLGDLSVSASSSLSAVRRKEPSQSCWRWNGQQGCRWSHQRTAAVQSEVL